jgi:hypothetical protein
VSLVIEIHVPLPGVESQEVDTPTLAWIDQIEDFLFQREDEGELEVFDDGEEYGEVYVFFIAGAAETALLQAASQVVSLDGVPAGAFAIVTDDQAQEFGVGRRVNLPT